MNKSKQSTLKLLNKFSFAQNSNVKLAVLSSILSLTIFFTVAFFSPFKDTLLATLFPKPSSYATSTQPSVPTPEPTNINPKGEFDIQNILDLGQIGYQFILNLINQIATLF